MFIKKIETDPFSGHLVYEVTGEPGEFGDDSYRQRFKVSAVAIAEMGLDGPYSSGKLARALVNDEVGMRLPAVQPPPDRSVDPRSYDPGAARARQAYERWYKQRRAQLEDRAQASWNRYETARKSENYKQRTEENVSMFREFKQYISENRSIIFTILLVAAVDQFFLGGALKGRIQRILEVVTDRAEASLGKDLNGDGRVGASNDDDDE